MFENKNPGEGKVILLPANITLDEFIKLASNKLAINGKKLYLEDGGLVDDMNLIRDNDSVYVSCGEPFCGEKAQKTKSNVPIYSIAVMGPGSVGKSAMTLQYVQGLFVMDYDPTIEDAYRKNTAVDGQPCLLDILDTAGQEDYTALRSTWMRERDGFILVFSVTEKATFDDLQQFYDQMSVMHEDNMPPIVLAGNKCDLPDERQVSTQEGQQLAEQYHAVAYVETSAKTGQNIDKAFSTLVKAMRKSKAQNSAAQPAKKKKWCTIL